MMAYEIGKKMLIGVGMGLFDLIGSFGYYKYMITSYLCPKQEVLRDDDKIISTLFDIATDKITIKYTIANKDYGFSFPRQIPVKDLDMILEQSEGIEITMATINDTVDVAEYLKLSCGPDCDFHKKFFVEPLAVINIIPQELVEDFQSLFILLSNGEMKTYFMIDEEI